MVAPEEVSVDTVIASVISEVERVSSLKEEQRTTLKPCVFCPGADAVCIAPASYQEVKTEF